MRYCFDLDDTICIHNNRDYPNAVPVSGVIDKIRDIRNTDPESEIVIHTARGMGSCKGDVRLAEERNRAVIEEWLEKYGVPYDEIIFGKPLADVYVDDKALSVCEFESGTVQRFSGLSGQTVMKVAGLIVKEGEKTKAEYEWFKADKACSFTRHLTPNIRAFTLGKLYMDYISGVTLSDILSADPGASGKACVERVIGIIQEFAEHQEEGENDVEAYCLHVAGRGKEIGIDTEPLSEKMRQAESLKRKTFCHGDFTPLNVIVSNGLFYLIDPIVSAISTWLLDASKFRASLNGLDAALSGRETLSAGLVPVFDAAFREHLEIIRVLEKTHIIRVMCYAKKQGKPGVFNALKRMLYL